MKKVVLLFLTFSLSCFLTSAQVNVKDSMVTVPMFTFSYGVQLPAGDMKDRFGVSSSAGVDFMVKNKKNWVFGADFHYIFGTDVKENTILDGMKTEQGEIIGQDGQFADIAIFERGYTTCLKVGKIFPLGKPNKNSGIIFTTGAGFMQHKIRIDVANNTAPQLTKETKKGYDRLTNGFMLDHFLGYMLLGNKRLLNFYGGFEWTHAFTQNRRDYNWDTMQHDTQKRYDMLYGIRIGFIIPFYKRAGKTYYY
ncbi:MAG: hypothetical protein AB7G44_08140 [Bacteroidia bacterium]